MPNPAPQTPALLSHISSNRLKGKAEVDAKYTRLYVDIDNRGVLNSPKGIDPPVLYVLLYSYLVLSFLFLSYSSRTQIVWRHRLSQFGRVITLSGRAITGITGRDLLGEPKWYKRVICLNLIGLGIVLSA